MIAGLPFDCKQYVIDEGQLPKLSGVLVELGTGLMAGVTKRLDKLDCRVESPLRRAVEVAVAEMERRVDDAGEGCALITDDDELTVVIPYVSFEVLLGLLWPPPLSLRLILSSLLLEVTLLAEDVDIFCYRTGKNLIVPNLLPNE